MYYPPPLQCPRIPVWVGGTWPGSRPFTRAARWDGVVPMRLDGPWEVTDTAAVAERMSTLRTSAAPFDLAVPGESDGEDDARHERHAEHARAGATWWVEAVHPWRDDLPAGLPWPSAARDRIDAGP
ncbi:LLM class oxidoreductase [Blastococcus deserti]|uniref:Luciferase-like monooxygenase n=1 Tax=Blastococcus deserti TaxID=2259033 RepID=A0ABW4XHC7_9ACTN